VISSLSITYTTILWIFSYIWMIFSYGILMQASSVYMSCDKHLHISFRHPSYLNVHDCGMKILMIFGKILNISCNFYRILWSNHASIGSILEPSMAIHSYCNFTWLCPVPLPVIVIIRSSRWFSREFLGYG
jgi:hypothetical protein